jgi:hypothetical protein
MNSLDNQSYQFHFVSARMIGMPYAILKNEKKKEK